MGDGFGCAARSFAAGRDGAFTDPVTVGSATEPIRPARDSSVVWRRNSASSLRSNCS